MNTDMTRGILCTIDFTESSIQALGWSVELARLLKTHLTILYTYRLFKSNGEAVELKNKMEKEAIQNFSVLEKEYLIGKGVSYDFKTEVGFVADRVRDHAVKRGASLLVMGRQMNSRSKESFDELAENIQMPLVIVP